MARTVFLLHLKAMVACLRTSRTDFYQ